MDELVLSAERRDELAALLNDEQRLRVEYPKVLDYLDTAPTLPGTGNTRADAAFDLRFVHFIISGSSSVNPYWDIVAPFVFEHEGRRVVNGGQPNGSGRLAYAEMTLQEVYAYAIPSPETLEWAVEFCNGRPLVELGAGRGYWAAQLARLGITVDAYDIEPPHEGANLSFSGRQIWHQVANLQAFADRASDQSEYVLFLCWPPGWGDTMASRALAEFEQLGGRRLIFIGEPKGGKTGDDAFFDALSAGWTLESQDARYVSWWNLNDIAQGWMRR